MRAHIKKWGNSLALRIPKLLAHEVRLKENAPVDVLLHDGKLVALPVIDGEFTLKKLLEQVTEENIHHEVETGPAVGKEVW